MTESHASPAAMVLQGLFAILLFALLALLALALSDGRTALWAVLVGGTFTTTSVILQSVVERMFAPAGPRKSLASWLLHLQVNILFSILRVGLGIGTFLGCAAVAKHYGFELGLIDLRLSTPGDLLTLIPSLWVASIVGDFFFYWYHRWTHVNQFLWQHHKMHHTDTELEAISTARQNWMEAVFNALFIAVPMIVLFKADGLSQWDKGLAIGLAAGFLENVLTLSHMNVRWHVGWLSRIWCAPQVHRIHHSLEPRHIDKNFAFQFPMWDVIFGTYYHPGKDEFPATGVAGEKGFASFWEAQIYSQREMWRYLRRKRQRPASATNLTGR